MVSESGESLWTACVSGSVGSVVSDYVCCGVPVCGGGEDAC